MVPLSLNEVIVEKTYSNLLSIPNHSHFTTNTVRGRNRQNCLTHPLHSIQPMSKKSNRVLDWLNVLMGLVHIAISIKRLRKKRTKHHLFTLYSASGLTAHFICVVLQPYIWDWYCGTEAEGRGNDDLKTCRHDVVDPVLMVLDQISISGMLFVTQMALSDRLNMIGQLNPLHVKIARNFVGFVELVAGVIQGFRLSGTTAPLLLSVMIIDLLWTWSLNATFFLHLRKHTTLSEKSVAQIAGDTFLRSLLYSVCHGMYYVGYKWTAMLPNWAIKVIYHLIVFTLLMPRVLMQTTVDGLLQRVFSTNMTTNSAVTTGRRNALVKPPILITPHHTIVAHQDVERH